MEIGMEAWLILVKKYGADVHKRRNSSSSSSSSMLLGGHDNRRSNMMGGKEVLSSEDDESPMTSCQGCQKCVELEERRRFEEKMVRLRDKRATIHTDQQHHSPQKWNILNTRWRDHWLSFIQGKTNVDPGPINNDKLLFCKKGKDGRNKIFSLREDVKVGKDFILIAEEVWSFLISAYGGGPSISTHQILKKRSY
eukprot:TRINITY_DN1875_c0_g2_i1.p1 TRINITY_DN1875_c0_g2~~TRINITY_DN1875_c0_g2_i1.p1  ORF type:complete len:195 (-),score=57.00 TRINITY_DN1875_c0_g2_i1:61-645(-)